ncbi:hypothetical protein V8C86DRAFT_2849342, partial [Haematococcus lacustris]
ASATPASSIPVAATPPPAPAPITTATMAAGGQLWGPPRFRGPGPATCRPSSAFSAQPRPAAHTPAGLGLGPGPRAPAQHVPDGSAGGQAVAGGAVGGRSHVGPWTRPMSAMPVRNLHGQAATRGSTHVRHRYTHSVEVDAMPRGGTSRDSPAATKGASGGVGKTEGRLAGAHNVSAQPDQWTTGKPAQSGEGEALDSASERLWRAASLTLSAGENEASTRTTLVLLASAQPSAECGIPSFAAAVAEAERMKHLQ